MNAIAIDFFVQRVARGRLKSLTHEKFRRACECKHARNATPLREIERRFHQSRPESASNLCGRNGQRANLRQRGMIDLERNATCKSASVHDHQEAVKLPANIVLVARKQNAFAGKVRDQCLNIGDVTDARASNSHRAASRPPSRSCNFSSAARTDSTDVAPGTLFLRMAASRVTAEK